MCWKIHIHSHKGFLCKVWWLACPCHSTSAAWTFHCSFGGTRSYWAYVCFTFWLLFSSQPVCFVMHPVFTFRPCALIRALTTSSLSWTNSLVFECSVYVILSYCPGCFLAFSALASEVVLPKNRQVNFRGYNFLVAKCEPEQQTGKKPFNLSCPTCDFCLSAVVAVWVLNHRHWS